MKSGLLLPREHGAWGMMLQPFVAAAILGRTWNWLLPVALLAVLVVFSLREPLLVLARQRWLWREPHPETEMARRTLCWEVPLLAVCGAILSLRVPLLVLAAMGAMALLLTAVAVWMTLKNRQRSVALQSASAFGLSGAALLAGYVATGSLQQNWVWWVWVLHAWHSLSGIFAVHARLDGMIALKNPEKFGAQAKAGYRHAWWMPVINTCLGITFGVLSGLRIGLPMLASAFIHGIELRRLRHSEELKRPLKQVGQRALFASIVHSLLIVAVLW